MINSFCGVLSAIQGYAIGIYVWLSLITVVLAFIVGIFYFQFCKKKDSIDKPCNAKPEDNTEKNAERAQKCANACAEAQKKCEALAAKCAELEKEVQNLRANVEYAIKEAESKQNEQIKQEVLPEQEKEQLQTAEPQAEQQAEQEEVQVVEPQAEQQAEQEEVQVVEPQAEHEEPQAEQEETQAEQFDTQDTATDEVAADNIGNTYEAEKQTYEAEASCDAETETQSENQTEQAEQKPQSVESNSGILTEQELLEEAQRKATDEIVPDYSAIMNNEDEDEDDDDEDDTDDDDIDEGNDKSASIRYNRAFVAKLIQALPEIKGYYNAIKNDLLSYKGVKSRVSWCNDSYNKGRNQLAKINVRGKTLMLYLALNPADYVNTKYRFKDVTRKKKFARVPMLVKIRSKRGLCYSAKLIADLMRNFDIEQGTIGNQVFTTPYETTEELMAKNLIRIVNKDDDTEGMDVDVNNVAENADAVVNAVEDAEKAEPECQSEEENEPKAEEIAETKEDKEAKETIDETKEGSDAESQVDDVAEEPSAKNKEVSDSDAEKESDIEDIAEEEVAEKAIAETEEEVITESEVVDKQFEEEAVEEPQTKAEEAVTEEPNAKVEEEEKEENKAEEYTKEPTVEPEEAITKDTPQTSEETKEETDGSAVESTEEEFLKTKQETKTEATYIKIGNKKVIVNLDIIDKVFQNSEIVDLTALIKRKLVPSNTGYVKICARGTVKKPLTVIADSFTAEAMKLIKAAGGIAKQKR